jgi:hypothetical protein
MNRMVSFTLRSLYSRRKSLEYTFHRGVGGSQGRSGRCITRGIWILVSFNISPRSSSKLCLYVTETPSYNEAVLLPAPGDDIWWCRGTGVAGIMAEDHSVSLDGTKGTVYVVLPPPGMQPRSSNPWPVLVPGELSRFMKMKKKYCSK